MSQSYRCSTKLPRRLLQKKNTRADPLWLWGSIKIKSRYEGPFKSIRKALEMRCFTWFMYVVYTCGIWVLCWQKSFRESFKSVAHPIWYTCSVWRGFWYRALDGGFRVGVYMPKQLFLESAITHTLTHVPTKWRWVSLMQILDACISKRPIKPYKHCV